MSISSLVHIEAWRYAFDELPAEIAVKFTASEREVYCKGSRKIIDSLRLTGEASAIKACDMFGESWPFHVYIDNFFSSPSIWFGLSSVKLKHEIRVMIRRECPVPDCAPSRIKRIFQAVGAIKSGVPHSPTLLFSKDAVKDGRVWTVIAYGDGCRLVLSDGNSAHYIDHETMSPCSVSLDFFLDEFLNEVFEIDDLFSE